MGQVMKRFPFKYCQWITKQMYKCNGCNRHLSHFESKKFEGKVEKQVPGLRMSGQTHGAYHGVP